MSLDFDMLDSLLEAGGSRRRQGQPRSGAADADFDYSMFDNFGTDDEPLYGFELDDLVGVFGQAPEDKTENYELDFDMLDDLVGVFGQPDTKQPRSSSGFGGFLSQFFPQRGGSGGAGGLLELLGPLALTSFLKDRGAFDPDIAPVGYQGKIPEYTAIREQVTGRDDTDRRPGSGGRRYFSDTMYAKKPEGQQPMSVEEARAKAKAQASGFMGGGQVLEDGGYLQGDSDGQADLVPGDIDGVQEARLSHGEYVLPADLVAILGNGNSDAGAAALDDFMSTVRKKATGTPKQQKNIDADQVLAMLSKRMS